MNQGTPLPGLIAKPHLDRQGLVIGLLRGFRLDRILMHNADPMPGDGDAARFIEA
jgi:hypothetical protein